MDTSGYVMGDAAVSVGGLGPMLDVRHAAGPELGVDVWSTIADASGCEYSGRLWRLPSCSQCH
jgi:hypothetical protein